MSPRFPYLIVMTFFAVCFVGCGSPQFSPACRELMKPLQTAISTRKPEWIDAAEKKIQAQHDAANISAAEFKTLSEIIAKTRSGDWNAAQRGLAVLIDGQRATADDLARLKSGQQPPSIEEHRKAAKNAKG
jgi:hypothetical protein